MSDFNNDLERLKQLAAQLDKEIERNFPVESACANGQTEIKSFDRK